MDFGCRLLTSDDFSVTMIADELVSNWIKLFVTVVVGVSVLLRNPPMMVLLVADDDDDAVFQKPSAPRW